jgi:glycosyltransferase involved in cell wall biosynthesis
MARICVISEWIYPMDARISREVRALVQQGHEVDVICTRWGNESHVEHAGRVSVYRLPIARRRGGALRYAFEFLTFQLAATLLVGLLHLRRRYDVVEAASLPDWLVFSAIVPRLLGARVLLDLHECMPEYGATKYDVPLGHPIVRVLTALERASIGFADFVITCTEQMREKFVERGSSADKIAVVLNSFDEERFDPTSYATKKNEGDDFVLISHGTIEENYGLDIIVRAVGLLRERIPGLRLEIYGEGTHRPTVETLVKELGLEDRVWFSPGFLPLAELLPHIAEADAGVVAVRRSAFRDVTLCTKMYDLVSMRRPVIISRTPAVEAYFGDGCFQMFESGNEGDLARAIYELYVDRDLRDRLVQRASLVNERYRWVHERQRYVRIVEGLVSGRAVSVGRTPLVTEGAEQS